MAYRITNRARERIQLMRAAKDAKRTSGSAPDYPAELPVLRRRIVVTDFDSVAPIGSGQRRACIPAIRPRIE